jgi:molecular chaperone GrpE
MRNDSDDEIEQGPSEVVSPDMSPAGDSADPVAEERGKAARYYDQLLRLQAEFSNYRKRTEKEKGDAVRLGKEIIIEKIIGLMDVMDQALKHANQSSDAASLKQGFQMVVDEFGKFLKSEGAEPIIAVGAMFDPHCHEALEQVPTENSEDNNKILEEIQKGYRLNGRLFRPARVKVACMKETKD